MDERGGFLRVASTLEPGPDAPAEPSATIKSVPRKAVSTTSEGQVSVLKVDGDRLARVGVVTGLGRGERIRGVRFDGDVGYVVTYRQTDPLYTVDLTDPGHPAVRGELQLPGYSAYLHPAGPGRLLGLGQAGTTSGAVTGLALSLFDVTDLAAPRRLAQQKVRGAWSDGEADHHAFTLAGDLVLVPYSAWWQGRSKATGHLEDRFDAGVIAVRTDAAGLAEPVVLRPRATGPIVVAGKSTAEQRRVQKVMDAVPVRTVVHSGVIYSLTRSGVAAHTADTFTRLPFASF